MNVDSPIEILKNAILMERRGQAFYQKVAEQSESKAVREFFTLMAAEEEKHIHVLSQQFKTYIQQKKFLAPVDVYQTSSGFASKILTQEVKNEISSAGFEAAAISAAIAMEKTAVALYSNRAGNCDNPDEKQLYEWLAGWENEHLNFLIDVEKELKEKIWFDNQFWPF